MSEKYGFSDDSLETSNILESGLTPFSEIDNLDSKIEGDSSYVDPIERELESLESVVQNISQLDESPLANTSELLLFEQSPPLTLDPAVADEEQSAALDSLTGSPLATVSTSNLNESFFSNGESSRITLKFIQRETDWSNEVGLYRVDDARGRIGELLPGDKGYSSAALDPARSIITLDNGAASVQFSAAIEPNILFGSYLIQNDTSQKYLEKNSSNQLDKKPLAFFSFSEGNPDNFDHLQTRVNDSGSIDLGWSDGTNGGEQDFTDSVFTISFGDAPINNTPSNYAVRAEGKLKLRGRGDYDGDPKDLDDDVLIYAGAGFDLAGRPILPVKRDEAGNPLVDGQNKQILVDDAIAVAPGYSTGKATQSIKHLLSGLTPPQMVDKQIVDVPEYSVIKQELLETTINDASSEVTLPALTRLNNASRWSSNFPAPGTTDNPTVVRVQRQGLTIPHQVDLSNYVIIVEQGDIKFQGSQHQLDNVVLVAESGKIDLGQAEVKDSSLLAAKSIFVRSDTNFVGDNLIANSQGKIEFHSSQSELEAEDLVRVIAAGDLSIKGRSTLKGEFLTQQDFLAQGRTSVYGSVGAKGDVTFNGRVEMHAIPNQIKEIRATIDTTSVTEDSGLSIVTVTLDAPAEETVTVDFATRSDTAQAGSDYQEVNGTISFAPGETVKTIEIPLLNDGIYEADEALVLELTNPQGMILERDSIVVSIINDDPVPEIVIDHPSFTELDTETGNMIFTVSLSNPSSFPVTVDYATEDDTAAAGSDYQAQTGTLTFEPGELEKTIEIPIIGDLEFEPDETFKLNLSNPINGVLSEEESIGTGTINNNDLSLLELNLNLTNDTGVNNTDNISSDGTVSGSIINQQGEISLSASFDDSNPTDFSDKVQPDGSFTLGMEQLEQLNGGDLSDGSYTLYLVATDSGSGVVRNSSLTFVLDKTAPTLELTTPLVDGDHSSRPRLIGNTDNSNIDSVSYSLDGELAKVITVDDNGNFDDNLDKENLNLGTHSVTVTATDIAGNQSQREVSFQVGDNFFNPNATNGWGAQNDSTLILGEQDSYVVETSIPVALGLETNEDGEQLGTRTISFDLDAVWDDLDQRGIEDQLLVYLVDPANPSQTLLDNGSEGTAVFSLAGEQSDFTPGLVGFDGSTVTIDASSLTDVTEGLLVFQLLNQDDDTGSIVTVNNLASTTDLEGFQDPVFPEDNTSVPIGEALNLDNLTVATDVETIIENVRFNSSTGEYRAEVSIQNNGEAAISRNTVVLFNDLPDGVELSSPNGTDSAGNPYLNLRLAILPGGLDLGGVSDVVEVVFTNPNLIRFGLNPTVLVGSPNVAPVLEPIGNLTVTPGEKLAIPLTATDIDEDTVTYKLQADGDLPTGMLDGSGTLKFNPQPDEIGSYEFTIMATDGAQEVSQTVTLDVVADSITTTRISGVIENVEQQPLAGVVIELGDLTTVTNEDGSFTIETDQPLTDDTLKVRGEGIESDQVYPFIAEKLPLVLGQEVYEGYSNVIERPIYLPALDVESGAIIDPSLDVTVTTDKIPGASVFVEAGSLSTQDGEAFTGTLSITEVPRDLTPAALPENLSPDMVVTIQPGEMVFETPAPLSLPNNAGWAAGMEMDLWSINPETGDFEIVGKGQVSDDGSVVETMEGGIRNSSWHFVAPPEEPIDPEEDLRNEDNKCPDCKASGAFNSEVEFHSGAVIETHNLTTYSSNGAERGITLNYDSLRADPRPIIHFGYDDVEGSRLDPRTRLIAQLTIKDNNGFEHQGTGRRGKPYGLQGAGVHSWSIPRKDGDLSVGLQADIRNLPSGLYNYSINSGFYLLSDGEFSGSTSESVGDFVHVNTIDSAFGNGWSIAGWQELVENSDGSVLLIDGDGGELLFESEEGGEGYVSPPGDFSTLEKLSDGTFKRTMKDQMVYEFNSVNQLQSVTDRNGNQTNYIYQSEGQLSKIVDPVGLETILTYNDAGLVSSITDPGERKTLLEYDTSGNLIRITDPDGTSRTWSYDTNRHMVSEIDQRGNQEQAFYDFFGRASEAILKDGSKVRVDPLQTQGLYSLEATSYSSPKALIEETSPTVSYADGNGNLLVTKVDQAGQEVASTDGSGEKGIVERNDNNLISTSVDAKGIETEYVYDELGNLLKEQDTLLSFGETSSNFLPTALIVNGVEDRSNTFYPAPVEYARELSDNLESFLNTSGFNTTVVESLPLEIDNYAQIFDMRWDLPITEEDEEKYLSHLQIGGSVTVFGEYNNYFTQNRNNSIFDFIEEAGGGQLSYVRTANQQTVLSPFDSPNPITENEFNFAGAGGILNKGTGEFITVDDSGNAVAINFERGALSNAEEGTITALFDRNFLDDNFIETNGGLNLISNIIELNANFGADSTIATKTYIYDSIFSQVSSYTDELGNLTLNDIDPNNGNILSTTRVVGEEAGDDDLTTSYTYTDAGLVDTMTDSLGRITDYDYDSFGRLITETSAVGTEDEASISYEYDLAGNQTAIIDENGNRTEYEYDQQNRVIRITEADPDGDGELTSPVSTFTYDKVGNLIETVDARDNQTIQEYDNQDRLVKTIDSLGQETRYEYDNVGNVIAIIDAEGRRTENIYDSRNRLIETIDPEANSTKYQYDSNDNVIAVIDPLGNITQNFYDTRDRLFITSDAEENVTSYEYDAANNLIAVVDANQHRTEFEYDDLNRQVKQIDALLQESSIIYDEVGNILTTTDEEGRTTELTYDNRDRLSTTTNAENGIASFEYDAVGNLIAVTDEENRTTNLTYDALNRQVEVTDPLNQKTTTTYDAVDNVTSIIDANNHSTNFTYDALNRPKVVTNHLGDTIETEYDKVGNVVAITDELERTTNFAYDERNLPTSITDPLGYTLTTEYDEVGNVFSVTDARSNTTSYEYDKLYRLIEEIDANNESTIYNYDPVGNLLGITDELERTTVFGYDKLNRQVSVTDPLQNLTRSEYDKVGNLISLTDANDHHTNFTYDKLNRQTVVTNHLGDLVTTEYDQVGNAIAITDELDRTTNFAYDELNRQTSVKDPLANITTFDYDPVGNRKAVTDANFHTTSYQYDELNRQTGITNALGDTFSTEYDAVGNVMAVTDELNRSTNFTYDERNLQTSVTNALLNTTLTEYDEVGNVIAITDANDNTTGFTYDNLNRQTVTTNAVGDTVETEYDAVDNVIAVTDELKRTTKFAYDERNLQTGITDPLEHTTTSVYDPVGNLLAVTDANNHTTSYEYDELNRQIRILDHLNQPSTFTYDKVGNLLGVTDELNRTSTYSYDQLNRQLTFTDALNQTTTNQYDPVGNLLSITDPLNLATSFTYDELNRQLSVTNPNSETTSYAYDKVGNQLSITDPKLNTTSYTYDSLNRTLTDTNQLGHTRSYTYDPVGNVIQTSDRNGREISFIYDNLNRNTAEIWLDEAGNPLRNINFQFDAASQLVNANDPDSAYSYNYDLNGRVTSVDNAVTPDVPNVVFDYTYDPVDNLTTVKDSINGVDAGVETFSYDELDRVTSITQSGNGVTDKRVDMSYDAASQMSGVTRYRNLAGTELVATSTYTFDDTSRLTDLVHQQNETTLAQFGLVYDAGDRITQFITPEGVSDFTYDDSDQLVDANYENQDDENYSYDDNGNRTNTGYVTGDNNQLLSDGTYDYEYDNEGNRVKKTEIATGEVTEYEWDYRNRLVDVETKDSSGNIIANSDYTYDVFDNRIGKSVDADGSGTGTAQVERYILDGDHIALTFDGQGNQTERFLHGLNIDSVLAQENDSGEVLWGLSDHLGSTRLVLDSDGAVVNNITYDSFGNVMVETNDNVNFRFLYTGRESDSETGLNYNRGRYYDPITGRFVSIDPIGFAAGDSNLYRYVGNNPLFYLDPSGFCGVGSSGDEGVKVAQSDISRPGECNWACQAAIAVGTAAAASWYWAKENIFGGDKNNDQSDEFEFEQKHPVEEAIDKAARERERILEDLIDKNQPLETTVKDNTIDPNDINIDIYEPASDPFNVEKFGEKDYNNDFDPNLDGYELDDTIRIEPTRDFDDGIRDLLTDVFESFKGPAAKEFDWEHIMDRHTPWGKTAQQSGKKDIFEAMTENQIKKAVQNAWKNREKIKTQKNDIDGDRIKYRGYDSESGYEVEIIFNKNTKTVETAYPVNK